MTSGVLQCGKGFGVGAGVGPGACDGPGGGGGGPGGGRVSAAQGANFEANPTAPGQQLAASLRLLIYLYLGQPYDDIRLLFLGLFAPNYSHRGHRLPLAGSFY
jgi:hypothetical protein